MFNKSESIKNISKALSQFQGEIKNPANTAKNPFYNSKYCPLSDLLNLVRPVLSKYGLSIIQNSSSNDNNIITITTLLLHETGEWIEGEPLTLRAEKSTPQGAGSIITYGRRYSISAILGISSEDDDDGNTGEAKPVKDKKPEPEKPKEQESVIKKLGNLLVKTYGKDKAPDALERLSSFKSKDGNEVKGLRDLSKLSEARARVIYGHLKNEIEGDSNASKE